MKCEQIREQLVETARGRELSSDLRAIVFGHAEKCAACALRLENERRLTMALGHLALQCPAAPARVEAAILRQMPVVSIEKQRLGPVIWAGATAVAASLLVGALLLRPQVAPPTATQIVKTNRIEVASLDAESSEFVPLPYAEAVGPDEATETIRVQLARESLEAMGVPVSDDRLGEEVQADILLGMDGTPRAIRIDN